MSPGHLGITSCTGGWAQTCSARPQCRILVAIESLVRFLNQTNTKQLNKASSPWMPHDPKLI